MGSSVAMIKACTDLACFYDDGSSCPSNALFCKAIGHDSRLATAIHYISTEPEVAQKAQDATSQSFYPNRETTLVRGGIGFRRFLQRG